MTAHAPEQDLEAPTLSDFVRCLDMTDSIGHVDHSERSRLAATSVILVSTALYAGVLYHVAGGPLAVQIQVVSQVVLLALAIALRSPAAVHITVLAFLTAAWSWSEVWPAYWPLVLLVPLLVYGVVACTVPALRSTVTWLRWGRLDRSVLPLTLLTVILSSCGLWLWFIIAEPDLGRFAGALPTTSVVYLVPIGLGFAVLNAAVEESIFRGILLQGLDRALGPGWLSLIIHALAFGLVHFRGVPDGWVGVAMAAVYGLMLGVIRRRSGGLLAPIVAHICADVVIFCILAFWIRQGVV